ncbi:hypothetical protein D3C76_1868760 [compost metagenome]
MYISAFTSGPLASSVELSSVTSPMEDSSVDIPIPAPSWLAMVVLVNVRLRVGRAPDSS